MDVWYLDTSALAKLVRPEAETAALRAWLDALHLAAARRLGADLAGVVAYDIRLVRAARSGGIRVISPE